MEQDATELVAQLGSGDWRRREQAYQKLLRTGGAAVPALVQGARHPDWRVRATSVALMDHLADTRCLDALRQAVKDECLHVRRHAAHALACQGCKPTPLELDVLGMLLELATKDPSLQVRRVATANLVLQPPSRRAAKMLREMIRNETDEKLIRRARLALRHHTTAA